MAAMNPPEGGPGGVAPKDVAAIVEFLEGEGIEYELVEHARVTSAAAEARATDRPQQQVAKTVVVHDRGAYMITAVPADHRLDLHKLRELLDATRELRLASEQEIAQDFPSLEVGAVPPFGPMVPAATVIDKRLLDQERILCPAGDHTHSVLVDPRDILRATQARSADICED
jgi:Ala-tRNA(Pro) deacylase